MLLEWSAFAIADREAILDYIEGDNPRAAALIDDRISKVISRLSKFPHSGREGRVAGTRELVIAGTPYIAVYCFPGQGLRILRILHGAQMWPPGHSR